MGTTYTLYCEAFINNKWNNIDLWRRCSNGEFEILPVIEGKSVIGGPLNWYGLCGKRINVEELSETTRNQYKDINPSYQHWAYFDYHQFFDGKDFELPEYATYLPKETINYAKAEDDMDILAAAMENGDYIDAVKFANMTPEAQKSFQYIEFTNHHGYRDVMRQIKRSVTERLIAYSCCTYPIRIVIYIS